MATKWSRRLSNQVKVVDNLLLVKGTFRVDQKSRRRLAE